MNKSVPVVVNEFGFHTLATVPSKQELQAYYGRKYYQEEQRYSHSYSDAELSYIKNKFIQKFSILEIALPSDAPKSVIELGAGEGWTLNFFLEKGWGIKGIDYSSFGVQTHNPHILDHLIPGDIETTLLQLAKSDEKYSVIWLDNVLEHVPNPLDLLTMCRRFATKLTILVIEVPNDFSPVQQKLLRDGHIDREFWVCPPDHISYFNRNGLHSICEASGWNAFDTISDYPIDLNLFNERTNYVMHPECGKACHQARISIENFINEKGADLANQYYRHLASLNLGRQIISFFKPKF